MEHKNTNRGMSKKSKLDLSASSMSFYDEACNNSPLYQDSHEQLSQTNHKVAPFHPHSQEMITMWSDKIFFAITEHSPTPTCGWTAFTCDDEILYHPFCNDFGPFSLAVVYRFCKRLLALMESSGSDAILFYTTGDARQAANCAFLIAAFLVMELGETADEACARLNPLAPGTLAAFRDASVQAELEDLATREDAQLWAWKGAPDPMRLAAAFARAAGWNRDGI